MHPLDAIIHSVPRGVLRSRIERLVLDVDAHRFATAELPRRDGQDAAAAPIVQKGLVLAKAALGEPLQACAQSISAGASNNLIHALPQTQRRRRVRAVAPAARGRLARAQDDLHGVAGRRRGVALQHDVHASPQDAALWDQTARPCYYEE